jgi:hypothetical protein
MKIQNWAVNKQKRRTSMKRILSVFLALVVSAALVVIATNWKHSVTAVHAQGGCSNATLTGNYAFIYSGSNAPGHSVTGKNTFGNAAVGVFTFDGVGNVTASYTAVFNGHAFSTSVPDTGTYTVNSDCTGTATDATIDVHFNLVTVGGGTEFFEIQTDEGSTDTLDAKKQ